MKGRAVVACLFCLALAPSVEAQVLPPPRPVRSSDDEVPAAAVVPAPGGPRCPVPAGDPDIAVPDVGALPQVGSGQVTPQLNGGGYSAPGRPTVGIPPAVASDIPLHHDIPPAVAGSGPALPRPSPLPEHTFWVENEVLLWYMQGARIPTLLSTSPFGSPAADAGILGRNGTTAIFGPDRLASGLRLGDRLRAGAWFDEDQRLGVEVGFLFLQTGDNRFDIGSNSAGNPILARPFVDAASGGQSADLVSAPGVVTGHFSASYHSTGLIGTGIWLRENFCSSNNPYCDCCHQCGAGCGGGGCGGCDSGLGGCGECGGCYFRFDSILGYRYLRIGDHLDLQQDTTNLVDRANGPAGTRATIVDNFRTTNEFHGLDLGITGDVTKGPWSFRFTTKVALGVNDAAINNYGTRTTFNTAGVPTTTPGGMLVQPTNFGRYTRNSTTAVPELNLNFGYNVTPSLRVFAGYTFLYWAHVARAGEQIDTTINANFINGGPISNNIHSPRPDINDSGMWVQGVNLGVEWRY